MKNPFKNNKQEDLDIVNKKAEFDKSYRSKKAWWPLFWIFVGISAIFLIWNIVNFALSFTSVTYKTQLGLALGDGFALILMFALFWIVHNLIDAKFNFYRKDNQEVLKLAKKHGIWLMVFRISVAVLTLICGLLLITGGFMFRDIEEGKTVVSIKTIRILFGVNLLLYCLFTSLNITSYFFVLTTKLIALDKLVPNQPIIESAKK